MRAEVKAFAKVVPSGKTVIYALQKSSKHLSLLYKFRQEAVSKPHCASLQYVRCNLIRQMTIRHYISIILLFPVWLFGQSTNSNKTIDTLVSKLKSWDYGYTGCFGATITDSTIFVLVDKGKPIAKQLIKYLDLPEKAIGIHVILSTMYGDTISVQEETVSKGENSSVKKKTINKLILTTSRNPKQFTHVIDKKSQKEIIAMWKRRVN